MISRFNLIVILIRITNKRKMKRMTDPIPYHPRKQNSPLCLLNYQSIYTVYMLVAFKFSYYYLLNLSQGLAYRNLVSNFLIRFTLCSDEGVHWGIQNGLQLSRSTVMYFKHNDMESLRNTLENVTLENKRAKKLRRYIVVEAVYQV